MADEGAGVQEAKVPERVVDGKPTLYCFETCPFCWKVRSLLSWKGVDFSKVEVDPMKKKELKWSDWSAVPVYVEADGTQVNDSNPILHWVNSNHTGGTPFPRAGEDESQDKWMDFSGDVLGKSIVAVIYSSYGDSRKALAYVSEVESFSRWQAFQAKWLGGFIMRMVGKSRAKMFELPPEENLEPLKRARRRFHGRRGAQRGGLRQLRDSASYAGAARLPHRRGSRLDWTVVPTDEVDFWRLISRCGALAARRSDRRRLILHPLNR